MLNNVLKKVQNTLNEGIKNVKMIVNTLNENRPILTIQEKKYYQDELIAEGGYALIYKIQSVSDEKMYALKKIIIQSPNHKKQIKREIKIWKELSKYSNIVELVDFLFTERHAYIVMEYCEEGTLLDFVNNHEGNISEVEALLIFNQILLGVNAMHSQKPPIAHRDLKIENILKKKRNYKICDFGSATTETFDPTTSDEFIKEQNFSNFEKHSTLYYRAPEMCDRYGEHVVSEKVDIWSLGCVLYTMVFKEQPFINAQKLEIINGNYNFPKDEQKLYSEKFLDLIRVMLTPNPDNRPDILKIMEWTNYWNDIDKIPLSPEVEEIKKKQIASGGLKSQSHKKKLLSAEEIEKIQNKLKSKEKKAKNYDEINEIFGFAKSKDDEEDQKEESKNT
jgi:serine/threonine protein kinase